MPIFRYFIFVGPVLLGLLLLADAQLPAPGPLAYSTNFYGMNHGVPMRRPATRLTVISAPAPDMNSPAVLAAAPEPVVTASAQAKPAAAAKPATAKPASRTRTETPSKKRKRVVRRPAAPDSYAQAWRFGSPTRLW